MKIATKTLATLLVIAMLSFSTMTASAAPADRGSDSRSERKLTRIYQQHDRKMELRASVLGMSTEELRTQLKEKSFASILRQHGFKSQQAFNTAVIGKVKDELHHRGWSDQKIEKFVQKRLHRIGKFIPQKTHA